MYFTQINNTVLNYILNSILQHCINCKLIYKNKHYTIV